MHESRESVILVVEDEPIVSLEITERLERKGYRIPEVVDTGDEVLNAVARVNPDLVLMDIRLNGSIDGIEAARRVKADFDIPIVFLTGDFDQATIERAADVNAQAYMLKPLDERQLVANIEMAIHGQKHGVRAFSQHAAHAIRDLLPPEGAFLPKFDNAGFVIGETGESGSLFDAFYLDDGRLVFYSVGVHGAGTLPSLIAYSLHDLVRIYSRSLSLDFGTHLSPLHILSALNRRFFPKADGSTLLSMILGFIDPDSGEFAVSSAGHPRALVQDSSVDILKHTGTALGAFRNLSLEEERGRLARGGRIIVPNEGLLSALAPGSPDGAYAFLRDSADSLRDHEIRDLAEHIRSRVEVPPASKRDDPALLLLERL